MVVICSTALKLVLNVSAALMDTAVACGVVSQLSKAKAICTQVHPTHFAYMCA